MQKRKILVIDDEVPISKAVKLILEGSDKYLVKEENNSLNALKTVKSFMPDLIFLDIAMPNIDGSQIACLIKKEKLLENTPIVFLTAIMEKEKEGFRNGYYFLTKPVTSKKMIEFVENIIK